MRLVGMMGIITCQHHQIIKDVLFGIVMTANGKMFLDVPFEEYNPNEQA